MSLSEFVLYLLAFVIFLHIRIRIAAKAKANLIFAFVYVKGACDFALGLTLETNRKKNEKKNSYTESAVGGKGCRLVAKWYSRTERLFSTITLCCC